jgi:predicted enzyme related to lactoylglutathione lyase
MADNTVRGRFVWHELLTPNGAGAHEFYSNVLGWQTEAWEHDPSYRMFAAKTGPLGAAVEKRDGVPQWIAYIGTDDVDATVEAATRLGASVTTPPTTVPNAGRLAVLTDPQGAAFGVHATSAEPRPEAEPSVGEFSWHELATNVDPATAFAFYSELFGWDVLGQHDMGAMGQYLLFGRNGIQRGGMLNKGEMGRPGPAYWVGYVSVADIDSAVEGAKSARGSLLNGPMDVPGGDRVAQLTDPHGAFFAVHMRAATAGGTGAQSAATSTGAPRSAKKTAKKTAAKRAAKTGAKVAAKKPAKTAAKKPAKKLAKKIAKKAGKKVAKKAAKKRPQKSAPRKAAKRGQAAKRTAKKAGRKIAGKAAKRSKPARRKRAK